jgi:hypothetical protein
MKEVASFFSSDLGSTVSIGAKADKHNSASLKQN